ncbi:FMN-binding protein [Methylibium sp.]|uniref:FMN-binding protein n=1 Tax=Methylibium sp. TaxID=2067992 RepID=UPI003D0E3DFF
MRFEIAATAVASALAPAGAFAVDYLSAEQAQKLMFPAADRFETRELALSAEQLRQLEAGGTRARSARWSVRIALQGSDTLGYVVVDDVVGKFELISYAVGIAKDGRVQQVEVLSYRESHGHEIRLPAWRRQFVGKTVAAPIRIGEDINNISGATLSCSHVTEGVRRIVAVVDLAARQGQL